MYRSLVIHVRFADDRYHGRPEWPPGPARLFQALVAGAACGALPEKFRNALRWLESLEAPVIASAPVRDGAALKTFVPNNDLDAVDGDPARASEIRVPKQIKPRLLESQAPLLYAWTYEAGVENDRNAQIVCAIADRLYQLGRGVDMAWADGEVIDVDEVEARFAEHGGIVYRPSAGVDGVVLACPQRGSLDSLETRHAAQSRRFAVAGSGRSAQTLFAQPPKPSFSRFAYASLPCRRLFVLRRNASDASPASWPLAAASSLVTIVRDGALMKLRRVLPAEAAKIERVLVGHGASEADKATRVRIIALPSIGHEHADQAVRRLLVEIPPNCPVRADDLLWAFSGLDLADATTGEVIGLLVEADERKMLAHYGVDDGAYFRWRTVTPMVLPTQPSIVPRANGAVRARREADLVHSVHDALRHAGVSTAVQSVRLQREPFTRGGKRADAFADGTRFAPNRLMHVEIAFKDPVKGPLIVGDGRYLGIGLMAPVKDEFASALALTISKQTQPSLAQRDELLHAVRRALMSRDAEVDGKPSTLFSGHEDGAGPARSGVHRHVYLIADSSDGEKIDRIAIVAPWSVDRSWRPLRAERERFDKVARSLSVVKAGPAGVIHFADAVEADERDPLFARATAWVSRTSHLPTRHAKKHEDAKSVVADDLAAECVRRGLPRPEVEILRLHIGPRGGLEADARLRFRVAVAGPIILGRSAHRGGGVFGAEEDKRF